MGISWYRNPTVISAKYERTPLEQCDSGVESCDSGVEWLCVTVCAYVVYRCMLRPLGGCTYGALSHSPPAHEDTNELKICGNTCQVISL